MSYYCVVNLGGASKDKADQNKYASPERESNRQLSN